MIETPRNRPAKADDGVRRGGGLRRLPELLGKVLDPASRRRGLAEVGVLTDWPSIVGPVLAARCQPVKLTGSGERGGTLHVHVAGAAALELQHGEPQLLERINSYFGYRAVARLRLVQAPLARPRRAVAASVPPLDAGGRAEIEAAVRPVTDEALRAALAGLGAAIKTRRKVQVSPPADSGKQG
jgi:hypothetical protein